MPTLMVTGFTPFAGRSRNASWELASRLKAPGITALEIPVIWGAPLDELTQAMRSEVPQAILGFGEGREGWFDIETLARQERGVQPDNNDDTPFAPAIMPGPASRRVTDGPHSMQRELAAAGFPVRVSTDAGQFLCEELLYTLTSLKEQNPSVSQVLFCHLPPFGTPVTVSGITRRCDESLLAAFGQAYLAAAAAVRAKAASVAAESH